MYIERVPNRNSPPAVLLRESFRQGRSVKKRTLANLSKLPDHAVETLRRVLKGETLVAAHDAFDCQRTLPHGHVAAVLGTLRRLGLHSLIARAPSRQRDLAIALIVARVIDPRSKLATARALSPETAASSLGELLQLGDVDQHELYDAMDWLGRRQPGIETRLARRYLKENTLVLYDITSTYVEGAHCPLAQRGYSRDSKKNKLQIVFGLLCSPEGCPIAVEVFDGNTSDPSTVASQVEKLRTRFGLARVVLVGDRGMLTTARIREDLAGVEGLRWITALRAPTIRKLIADGTVHPSLFDQRDLAEVTSDDFPGERLIVCRNPRLVALAAALGGEPGIAADDEAFAGEVVAGDLGERLIVCRNPRLAAERRRKRDELLDATEALLQPIVAATRRKSRPLRGKEHIGVRVGKVIDRFKVGKHFQTSISDDSFSFQRLDQQIATEQLLDGIYIVRSNVEPERLDASQTVRAYKNLSSVERAFRSLKSVDLKVRPIHHRRADRVRAHVLLCMLAYFVEWNLRNDLAPLLFDDHDPDAAERLRDSVVRPAQRSPAARHKAARKRTHDHLPVHSFQSLLTDLGTLSRNTMRLADSGATFTLYSQPTPVQQRSFELLNLPHRL